MLKYLLFALSILNFSSLFSQDSSFELKIENDSLIIKGDQRLKLKELSEILQADLNKNTDTTYLKSINLKVDNLTGDVFLEKVKKELKKTDFDVLNVQRTSIQNFSNSNVVTEPMLTQYNTLIKNWKNLEENERYYRDLELKFITEIYKSMSFEQQINNQKLPSFLPIFNHKPEENLIEQFLFEKWVFDDSYHVYINDEKIDKSTLKDYSPQDFDHYYVERKIINENKIDVIHLVFKN